MTQNSYLEVELDRIEQEIRQLRKKAQEVQRAAEEQPTTMPRMVKLKEASEITGMPYYWILQLCKRNVVSNVRAGQRFYVNSDKLVQNLNAPEQGAQESYCLH